MKFLVMLLALAIVIISGCSKSEASWKCPECGCELGSPCGCAPGKACQCKEESCKGCCPECDSHCKK